MPHATSVPPGTPCPPLTAAPGYRVIYHAQVCPDCGSDC
jgi:hypothetical protein